MEQRPGDKEEQVLKRWGLPLPRWPCAVSLTEWHPPFVACSVLPTALLMGRGSVGLCHSTKGLGQMS